MLMIKIPSQGVYQPLPFFVAEDSCSVRPVYFSQTVGLIAG